MKEVSIRCEGARSISIDELFPFQDDIKTMKPSTLRKLEKVILEQGFSEPIAVWANSPDEKMWILNGHQRMTALQSLKSKGYFIPPIPVTMVQAEDEQEARKKVLTLASQFGDFDGDNLAEFVAKAQLDTEWIKDNARLAAGDFKLPMLMTPVDEEPHPEPEAIPIVHRGEVYILGNHRLMCGDSTSSDDFELLMNGSRGDLMFTSPPYGVGLQYNSYNDSFENTKSVVGKVLTCVPKFVDGYVCLNWGDIVSGQKINDTKFPSQWSWFPLYNAKLNENEFWLWAQRIWKKPHAKVAAPWSASSNRNATDWEYLFTWSNGLQKMKRRQNDSHFGIVDSSLDGQTNVLENHPGAFPMVVAKRIVEIHTFENANVIDPFSGTGTTLIACEKTKRRGFMMEIDPLYCGVIIDRWEKFADKQAIRESDGRLWLDIKAEALST